MCINCNINRRLPSQDHNILIRCMDTDTLLCTESRYDKIIQGCIDNIPGEYRVGKEYIAERLMRTGTITYNHFHPSGTVQHYTAEQYAEDLKNLVELFGYLNCTTQLEMISLIDLVRRNLDKRKELFPIIDNMYGKRKSFTRFKRKYTWVNSRFYKLLKKIGLV